MKSVTYLRRVIAIFSILLIISCESKVVRISEYLTRTDEVRILCRNSPLPEYKLKDKVTIDKLARVFELPTTSIMPKMYTEFSRIEYYDKGKYLFSAYYTDSGLHYLYNNGHFMAKLPAKTDSLFRNLCK